MKENSQVTQQKNNSITFINPSELQNTQNNNNNNREEDEYSAFLNEPFHADSLNANLLTGMAAMSKEFFLRNFIFDCRFIYAAIPRVSHIPSGKIIMTINRTNPSGQSRQYVVCADGMLGSLKTPSRMSKYSKEILFGRKQANFQNSSDRIPPKSNLILSQVDIFLPSSFSAIHCSLQFLQALAKPAENPIMLFLKRCSIARLAEKRQATLRQEIIGQLSHNYQRFLPSICGYFDGRILKIIRAFIWEDKYVILRDLGSRHGTFIDIPFHEQITLDYHDYFMNHEKSAGFVFLGKFNSQNEAIITALSNQFSSIIRVVFQQRMLSVTSFQRQFSTSKQQDFPSCLLGKFETIKSKSNCSQKITSLLIFIKDTKKKFSVVLAATTATTNSSSNAQPGGERELINSLPRRPVASPQINFFINFNYDNFSWFIVKISKHQKFWKSLNKFKFLASHHERSKEYPLNPHGSAFLIGEDVFQLTLAKNE